MGDEPVIALFHKNYSEAGGFRCQCAVFVAQEIIEANRQNRSGGDDLQLLFDELHLVPRTNHNLEVIGDGFPANSQSPAARSVQGSIFCIKLPNRDIIIGVVSRLPFGEERPCVFDWP